MSLIISKSAERTREVAEFLLIRGFFLLVLIALYGAAFVVFCVKFSMVQLIAYMNLFCSFYKFLTQRFFECYLKKFWFAFSFAFNHNYSFLHRKWCEASPLCLTAFKFIKAFQLSDVLLILNFYLTGQFQ